MSRVVVLTSCAASVGVSIETRAPQAAHHAAIEGRLLLTSNRSVSIMISVLLIQLAPSPATSVLFADRACSIIRYVCITSNFDGTNRRRRAPYTHPEDFVLRTS